MKLPPSLKHAFVEAMILQYTENDPSLRICDNPLTFKVPIAGIRTDAKGFGITDSDILDTVTENRNSLSLCENGATLQFIAPFTRKCNLYDAVLDDIMENTSRDQKFTMSFEAALKEGLIYHFFTGSIVLLVPDGMTSLSQLRFSLMAGGSKLRAIMDSTGGGWVYVFPKYIMEFKPFYVNSIS
ncbi:hypothetical protein [Methanolobus sp. WCC5]|uniref:hypothetical protein n=1 Tax=Methanolobus sp. WCC5 TaxID=3125785 RepID=UPI00324AD0BA